MNREERSKRALAKARNRGMMSEAWHAAGNKLTPETIKEFKALMKMADKDFEEMGEKRWNELNAPKQHSEDTALPFLDY